MIFIAQTPKFVSRKDNNDDVSHIDVCHSYTKEELSILCKNAVKKIIQSFQCKEDEIAEKILSAIIDRNSAHTVKLECKALIGDEMLSDCLTARLAFFTELNPLIKIKEE